MQHTPQPMSVHPPAQPQLAATPLGSRRARYYCFLGAEALGVRPAPPPAVRLSFFSTIRRSASSAESHFTTHPPRSAPRHASFEWNFFMSALVTSNFYESSGTEAVGNSGGNVTMTKHGFKLRRENVYSVAFSRVQFLLMTMKSAPSYTPTGAS